MQRAFNGDNVAQRPRRRAPQIERVGPSTRLPWLGPPGPPLPSLACGSNPAAPSQPLSSRGGRSCDAPGAHQADVRREFSRIHGSIAR